MSALSEVEQAFEDALDALEEAQGFREKAGLRGQEIDVLVGKMQVDEIPVTGGWADKSPTQISLRKSDVETIANPLNKLEPIILRGQQLFMLQYFPLEGRIDMNVGDPASEVD